MFGMTPFRLLDGISPEDVFGIKATDEETGHNKSKEHLARKMGKYVEKSQRRAINKWAEETKIGRCERTARHSVHSGR